MRVLEVMSTPAITVSPDDTLEDAIGAMLANRVGSVVVIDAGVIGIFTRSDVLRVLYERPRRLGALSVREGMSEGVVTIAPDSALETAVRMMHEHEIKKLPVIDDMDLIGIITATDIARQLPARVQEVRDTVERKDRWTA